MSRIALSSASKPLSPGAHVLAAASRKQDVPIGRLRAGEPSELLRGLAPWIAPVVLPGIRLRLTFFLSDERLDPRGRGSCNPESWRPV